MTPEEVARSRLTRSAALASTAVALSLLGLKAWAAIATGSVAMLGSLADTALDLVASDGRWLAKNGAPFAEPAHEAVTILEMLAEGQ